MNKEQSADDPSDRFVNIVNSTISMSYPDVVIACIEHKIVSEALEAGEGESVGEAQYMLNYSLVVD